MPTHTIAKIDSLTPIGVQLKQKNSSGVLAARDVTGKTCKWLIVSDDDEETEVMAETTTGLTVVTAADGSLSLDLPIENATLNAGGTFRVYVRVYGAGGEATEKDTHPTPNEEKRFKLIVAGL